MIGKRVSELTFDILGKRALVAAEALDAYIFSVECVQDGSPAVVAEKNYLQWVRLVADMDLKLSYDEPQEPMGGVTARTHFINYMTSALAQANECLEHLGAAIPKTGSNIFNAKTSLDAEKLATSHEFLYLKDTNDDLNRRHLNYETNALNEAVAAISWQEEVSIFKLLTRMHFLFFWIWRLITVNKKHWDAPCDEISPVFQ